MPQCLRLCERTARTAVKDRKKYEENHVRDCVIPAKIDYYALNGAALETQSKQSESEVTEGDHKLKALVKTLNRFDEILKGKYLRSKGQRTFHKAFIGACLRKIFGTDIYRNLSRLLVEYDLDELRSDVIICTPRRFGKTMSVALFVAAYILTQPDAEISIFSTGRRASRKILALIWKMVVDFTGDSSIVVTYNMEALEVKNISGHSIGKCFSYPSKVQIDNVTIDMGEILVYTNSFFFVSSTETEVLRFPRFYRGRGTHTHTPTPRSDVMNSGESGFLRITPSFTTI